IIEGNLNSTWYSLDGGLTNISFFGLSGTIDENEWESQTDGGLYLNIYANDTLGNLGYAEVFIMKDSTIPLIKILSPNQYQLFGRDAIAFNVSITSSTIDKRWYSLNGGMKYFFSGLNGTIDQNAWDVVGNGSLLLKFYVNNSAGTMNFDEVTILKDELAPIISILSPTENQIFGSSIFDFSLAITEGNLNSTWYSLDGGLTNYLFVGLSGTIDQIAWD
ncbi:hypothetical protein LCGC14_1516010, partial [marine sediment metagenome]